MPRKAYAADRISVWMSTNERAKLGGAIATELVVEEPTPG
jgi:hypothetical protein